MLLFAVLYYLLELNFSINGVTKGSKIRLIRAIIDLHQTKALVYQPEAGLK